MPITKYCDENKLTTRQRLELFTEVCQAVQHAHQKGIIHRDLKPSNVMVTLHDGRPVPKVIDFGVAKATSQRLTERTMFTQFGQMIGTIQYMSPEQAEMSRLDIDTRSDIYSLGVMLYELLTGSTPLDRTRFNEVALDEIQRMIREEEPPKPSTRLSTTDELVSISAQRSVEPKKLSNLIRGDLDWIVMKSLEKDRARRYESASNFAADVRRYLADEPVEACPPSAGYKLRKFARRNKAPMTVAAAIALLLLCGTTISTWQAIRATRAESLARRRLDEVEQQRDRATQAEGLASDRLDETEQERDRAVTAEHLAEERLGQVETEKENAEREKQIALAVKDFLQNKLLGQADVTAQADALLKAGRQAADTKQNPTIRELLDRAAEELTEERIEKNFPGQPLLQAEILHTVGETYRGVGEYQRAIELLRRARELRSAQLGPEHPSTLASLHNLATAYADSGQLDRALPLFEETLKLVKAKLGPEHPHTLASMNDLATAYFQAGKLNLALPLLEETLKLFKAKLGPEHPHTLNTMNNLAMAYEKAGKLDLALPLFEKTLKLRKTTLVPEHPDTLTSIYNLARAYAAVGKLGLALPLYEEALKPLKANLGLDHPRTLYVMNALARAYWLNGQLDKSIPLFEETLKLTEAKLGPDHARTLERMANLGVNYKDANRLEEARPLLEKAYQAASKHDLLHWVPSQLADLYEKTGKLDQVILIREEAVKLTKPRFGLNHPRTAGSMFDLGAALLKNESFAKAESVCRECLAIREKIMPDHWLLFHTQSLLGATLLGQKKYAAAEPLLLAGYEGMKERESALGANNKIRLTESRRRLIQLYKATGKEQEAANGNAELKDRQEKESK